MNRLTDLKHDVKNVQDTVLADLDTEQRVRMFVKAAAEDMALSETNLDAEVDETVEEMAAQFDYAT